MNLSELIAGIKELKAEADSAYLERNKLVAALAKLYPSGIELVDRIDWKHFVYIDLPTGQVYWPFPESQRYLFSFLPKYPGTWDGHNMEENYRRLSLLERGDCENQTGDYSVNAMQVANSYHRKYADLSRRNELLTACLQNIAKHLDEAKDTAFPECQRGVKLMARIANAGLKNSDYANYPVGLDPIWECPYCGAQSYTKPVHSHREGCPRHAR